MSEEREHVRARLDTGPHTKVGPDATVSVRAGAKVRGLDGEVIGEVTGVVLNDDGVFIDMALNPGTVPEPETSVSLPDPPYVGRSYGRDATCAACGSRVDERYTGTHTEVCPGLVSRARRVQIERDLIAESFKPMREQPDARYFVHLYETERGDRLVYQAAESVYVCFQTDSHDSPAGEWLPGWRPTPEGWRP